MYRYLEVGGFNIPSYSMMIIVGLIVCNLIAQQTYKVDRQKYLYLLQLELLGGIGAVLGAKMLSLMQFSIREGNFSLSWSDFTEAGYSYYGGIAGFFIITCLFCKIKEIDGQDMAREYLYLLPLLHVFWKVGCLLGGCCYGIEYTGPVAIIYPQNANQMSGISVFPSPLIEAIVSLLISVVLLVEKRCSKKIEFVGMFFILYGTTRFFLEYFRYHDISSILSDGQVNSVICGGIGFYLYISKTRRMRNDE